MSLQNSQPTQIVQPVNFSFLNPESKEKMRLNSERISQLQTELDTHLSKLNINQDTKEMLTSAIDKIKNSLTNSQASQKLENQVNISKKVTKSKLSIPENIKNIYIDASTLLFMDSNLSKLATKSKRPEAEKLLAELTNHFSELSGKYNVVLVFNKTDVSLKGTQFEVFSASSKYKSVSDAMVDLASKESYGVQNCLFVSSDKDIQARLSGGNSGVTSINFMMPARWFRLMQVAIGQEKFTSLVTKNQNENSGLQNTN